MGSVVFRSDGSHITNEIAVTYYPYDLVNGIPRVGIGRYRDGGTLPADRWLGDKWAGDVLDEGRAQWFLGYLDRMDKGETVPMWEIAREYENRHDAPMQVLLPPLPTGLSFESYCCRQHHFGAEAPSSAMVQFPLSTPVRDGCWRALLDCRVGAGQRTESDYCIAYYESSYRGEPRLLVQRGKRGALYAARRASLLKMNGAANRSSPDQPSGSCRIWPGSHEVKGFPSGNFPVNRKSSSAILRICSLPGFHWTMRIVNGISIRQKLDAFKDYRPATH